MREELYKIAKEVSHDVASPVSALNIAQHALEDKKEFPEMGKKMSNLAIRSIEDMADKLLSKYRKVKDIE
jgi:hypothetical protein